MSEFLLNELNMSCKNIKKLDRSMRIYELLEELELPDNGQLILPIATWKRKHWVTKKYVLEYDEMNDSLSIGIHLFELDCYSNGDKLYSEYHVDTYEVHTIW